MSIGFNWFKEYTIEHHDSGYWYDWFDLHYCGGGSTSHSAGNVIKVQTLFEKYGGRTIPTVDEEYINSINYNLDLIDPSEMIIMCDKVLASSECDEIGMRDRVEWFKELSKRGYYLTYNLN